MKKLSTLLVLFTLVLAAAPPVHLTIDSVECAGGNNPPVGTCSQPIVHVSGADPAETYVIEIIGPATDDVSDNLPPTIDGNIDYPAGGFLAPGDWTFEVHKVGNNTRPMHKALDTFALTVAP